MPHNDRLNLEGPLAQQFLEQGVGKEITITIQGKLIEIGMRPDYSEAPGEPGKKSKEPKLIPHAEIQILKVNGKGGKSVKDMDSDEFEKEVHEAKQPK